MIGPALKCKRPPTEAAYLCNLCIDPFCENLAARLSCTLAVIPFFSSHLIRLGWGEVLNRNDHHTLDAKDHDGSMSHLGHSRPGRASSKSGHVRYAPIATSFRSPAK